MDEFKVKYLSAYLPYGVKVTADNWGTTLKLHFDSHRLNCISIFDLMHQKQVKLKLRPISQLTKEIEHKGKKFIPFYALSEIYDSELQFNDLDAKAIVSQSIILMKEYGYEHCQTWVFEKLKEWHFDVFGLIEKGLAVPLI